MAIITINLSDADIYREGADNVERAIEVVLRNISVSVMTSKQKWRNSLWQTLTY